jgi:uncharacterized protein
MATGQENENRAREAYEAFARADLDAVRRLLHPDILWHIDGNSPLTGNYKGIDEVLEFFGTVFTETDGTFRKTLQEVIANESTTVTISSVYARRKGTVLDDRQVAVYRCDSEGRVMEANFYYEDSARFDEFWM